MRNTRLLLIREKGDREAVRTGEILAVEDSRAARAVCEDYEFVQEIIHCISLL